MRAALSHALLVARRHAPAPSRLLLLGALGTPLLVAVFHVAGVVSIPVAYVGTLPSPMTPMLMFRDGGDFATFESADAAVPLRVPVDEIAADLYLEASMALGDGEIRHGDSFLYAHRWGRRWVTNPYSPAAGGWQATGWTIAVLHRGAVRVDSFSLDCPSRS